MAVTGLALLVMLPLMAWRGARHFILIRILKKRPPLKAVLWRSMLVDPADLKTPKPIARARRSRQDLAGSYNHYNPSWH